MYQLTNAILNAIPTSTMLTQFLNAATLKIVPLENCTYRKQSTLLAYKVFRSKWWPSGNAFILHLRNPGFKPPFRLFSHRFLRDFLCSKCQQQINVAGWSKENAETVTFQQFSTNNFSKLILVLVHPYAYARLCTWLKRAQ